MKKQLRSGELETGGDLIEISTIRAISWRIIPFVCLCYFLSYIDRVNLSFAALEMNGDLHLSPMVYGWGAGIFFVGYSIFEVPSNVALERFGARRWIARIMVTWGLLSSAMTFVVGPNSFYVLRFLLGVAEAGFLPGIIFYLSCWYPAAYRARVLALFIVAVPVSVIVGAPLSGFILGFSGSLGLKGWQWIFILEGFPSIIMGIVTWFYLVDTPDRASWLNDKQKRWLLSTLAAEAAAKSSHGSDLASAIKSPRVWAISVIYLGFTAGLYGLSFWLPLIVKEFGFSNVKTGLISAVPYIFAAFGMLIWARHSDRKRERVWHVALALLLSAIGLGACTFVTQPLPVTILLTVAAVGVFATSSVIWTLPTAFLTGTAAAGGIAIINSVGNLAGMGGPYLIGWVKQTTGSTTMGLSCLAIVPLLAALLLLLLRRFLNGDDIGTGTSVSAQPPNSEVSLTNPTHGSTRLSQGGHAT